MNPAGRLIFSPNGASHDSPGQRPGIPVSKPTRALKGRPKPCRNPSPASMCTWFSAPRTANPSSQIPSADRCTPTWPTFSKTSTAIRSSSTRSKTTSTFFSNSPAPSPSVRPWKTSKNPHPNGSSNKPRSFEPSHGNRDTASSPFPNPTSKPCGNTSPIKENTTAKRPFRTNTGSSSNGTGSHSMKNTSGIDLRFGSPRWGSGIFSDSGPRALPFEPRALPWAIVDCPFGARDESMCRGRAGTRAMPFATVGCPFGANDLCPKGANYDSPGQRPGNMVPHHPQALKGRPLFSTNGAIHASLGHRPRTNAPTKPRALKGRPMVARANDIPIWLALTGLHPFVQSTTQGVALGCYEAPLWG